MNINARGVYDSYITFIDDYSIFEYVYLMHHKSEIFGKFKEFCVEVEKKLGLSVNPLRSNWGGEFLLIEF